MPETPGTRGSGVTRQRAVGAEEAQQLVAVALPEGAWISVQQEREQGALEARSAARLAPRAGRGTSSLRLSHPALSRLGGLGDGLGRRQGEAH